MPAKGVTISQNYEIGESIRQYQDILLSQIELLDPHVLIAGNTLLHYHDAFGLRREDAIQIGSLKYYIKNEKLYIDAYHPAQRTVKRKDYIDEIIDAAEHWHSRHLIT